MDNTIVEFIKALRGADVRVSTSEAIDAIHTVDFIGYDDREDLKHALSIVIPKTESDKIAFDETFDRFFAFNRFDNVADQEGSPAERGPGQQTTDADPVLDANSVMDMDSEAYASYQNFLGEVSGRGDYGKGEAGGSGGGQGVQSQLGNMLLSGDQAGLSMRMAQAARAVGLRNIRVITQKGLYGRKMMMEMGLAEMEGEMWDLEKREDPGAQQLAQKLREARNALREEVKDYVGKQFVLHAAEEGRKLREDTMRQVKLQHLYEFKNVQETVRKMAKKLVSIHSRRRRVLDRGKLDVRNTLRKNIIHDGILIEPQWKSKRIDRPKVMAICDVSGSVSAVARFLLMFLYSLTEVLPKVRAFAFSSGLGEVTEVFERMPLEKAIDEALNMYGMGSTDYGNSLEDFRRLALDDVDHNTTVIILGDARNNYGDSRSEIMREIRERAKMVIWLNPEPKTRWNSGDAIMRQYAPYCTMAEECNSLNHLERVVSRLLRMAV